MQSPQNGGDLRRAASASVKSKPVETFRWQRMLRRARFLLSAVRRLMPWQVTQYRTDTVLVKKGIPGFKWTREADVPSPLSLQSHLPERSSPSRVRFATQNRRALDSSGPF